MYVASDHPPRGTACAPRGRGSPDLAMRHPPAATGGPTDHTRSGSARDGARLPSNSWSSVQLGGTVKESLERLTIRSSPLYQATVAPPVITSAPGGTACRKRTFSAGDSAPMPCRDHASSCFG